MSWNFQKGMFTARKLTREEVVRWNDASQLSQARFPHKVRLPVARAWWHAFTGHRSFAIPLLGRDSC